MAKLALQQALPPRRLFAPSEALQVAPVSKAGVRPSELELLQDEVKRLKRDLAAAHVRIAEMEAVSKTANALANKRANSPANAANGPANSGVDRKAYMRDLMRAKRAKAKAVVLPH